MFPPEQEENLTVENMSRTSRTCCNDLLLYPGFLLQLPQKICHHIFLVQKLVSSVSDGGEDVQDTHGPQPGPDPGPGPGAAEGLVLEQRSERNSRRGNTETLIL